MPADLPIQIAPMLREDVRLCLPILWRAFGDEAHAARFDLTAAHNAAMGYPPVYLVAWIGDRLVGIAGYIEAWGGRGGYDLSWLAVEAEYQGRGIGRRLVLACIADLPPKAVLSTTTDKPGFYAKLGFEDRGSFNDARQMTLELARRRPAEPVALKREQGVDDAP